MKAENGKINGKWLYIPIETKVRELQAKLLLAFAAAEAGFSVVIGQKNHLSHRLKYYPRGIFMGFGLAQNFAKKYHIYRSYGHKIVAFDEEGLVVLNKDVYKRYKVSSETLDKVDLFFAWGSAQGESIISKNAKAINKVILTGSVRFDLLRKEYRLTMNDESIILRNKYGPFILVNTNFGQCNHYHGAEFYLNSLKKKGWMSTPEDQIFHHNRIEFYTKIYHSFIEMISKISSSFPNHKIIVRPHPSESFDEWKKHTVGLPNVEIIHEGNVVPWIIAADALVHNGCTTGVEAFALDAPVISYRPYTSELYDIPLPNALSINVYNIEDLINTISETIQTKDKEQSCVKSPKMIKIAEENISALTGLFAYERMIKSLCDLKVKPNKYDILLSNVLIIKLLDIFLRIKEYLRYFVKRGQVMSNYEKHKFSGLELSEILNFLNKLKSNSGNFSRIKVIQIGECCYKIKKI